MKLNELSEKLECQLEGDEAIEIKGLATLEAAREGDLSFLTNVKYFSEARLTQASAIIAGFDCPPMPIPVLKNKNPYLTFAKAVEIFHPPINREPHIHPTSWIAETVQLGKDVSIGAYSYIGDGSFIGDRVKIGSNCTIQEQVVIGEETTIHSGSVIREKVTIGKRCIIQNNAVIGSDGFGYAKQEDKVWYKIIQAGIVILEDGVEVGACTTIDRGTLGETRIASGTKIDNLVQVGHGSVIGRNTLLCAQVGLAGSTKIGENVLLAGQVGVVGHLSIGDGVIVTAQSGVPGSLEPGTVVSGSPCIDNKRWLKSTALFGRLPEIQKSVRNLERRIETLENTFTVLPEKKTDLI